MHPFFCCVWVCLESFPPHAGLAVPLIRFCFVHISSFNSGEGVWHSLVWACGVKMAHTNLCFVCIVVGAGAFSVFSVSL